jgi:succinoglycan biosynthesis protein ExoO
MSDRPDPLVSVIVANYNAAAFLEPCLRSILAQSIAELEVLIVDDVSTDDGVAVARRIAAEDGRVIVIERSTNAGPAAARNLALDRARGRWVAIVDSDDLIHPDRFAQLIDAAEKAGADIVADDLLVFDDGNSAPPRRFLAASDRDAPFRLTLDEYLRRSVLYGPNPDPGFLKPVIRRARLEALHLRYDETLRIAEDADLAIRLLLAGLEFLVVPVPWYYYRKHGSSISHRLTLKAVEAMQAADAALMARVTVAHPELESRCRTRARALTRVLAFERTIAAVKARRPLAAIATLIRAPAALPLLRMPIGGRLVRLRRRAPSPASPAEQERALVAATACAIAEHPGAGLT